MIFKTNFSRVIFAAGIVITFIIFHFTDAIATGGGDFNGLFSKIIAYPTVLPVYLGIIIAPALIASVLIPWLTKLIRSGD